jgi:formamidopyrimidine-DNA glycosylase
VVGVPELPEVETIRRYLAPVLEGSRLIEAELRHPRTGRRNSRPQDVVDRLGGRRVSQLRRHGKFLFADLDRGLTWITHLGMSGHLQIARPGQPEAPHTHFVAHTNRDVDIRLVDPRTFGFVAVLTPAEMATFTRLGPDLWNGPPDGRQLGRLLSGRTAPIKALLLDQRLLAGLGNIYADEILHRARLQPLRLGGSLSPDEVRSLRASIRPVLKAGIEAGGTTLSDLAYLLPDGRAGENLERLRVYGREGEDCRRCGALIERVIVGGRSSFYCPRCQR